MDNKGKEPLLYKAEHEVKVKPFYDELRENPMLSSFAILKDIGEKACWVEQWTLSRSIEGYKKLEIQILNYDGSREFYVYKDTGYSISQHKVRVKPTRNFYERNAEIERMHREEGLSQEFIGKIFGLAQPTVSTIIKKFRNK